MNEKINDIEKRLWNIADQLRANSDLSAAEYKFPVLGLIFLRFAGHKFESTKKIIDFDAKTDIVSLRTSK